MNEIELSKEETSLLTRESMISLMGKLPRATLDKASKKDEVIFANKFEAIGYGFVGVRSNIENLYDIMIEVDPMYFL